MEEIKQFIFNLETTKIELEFSKEEYNSFSEEDKKMLKSAFLFSCKRKCWVSRAKEPNLYRAKEVARKLGFSKEIRKGERICFAEQLQKKVNRAEQKAERYQNYANNAEKRGEILQSSLHSMHGDIAFFTQPIISGHSGSEAFAKRRERIFKRYEKGFEEYRKSEYFRKRVDIFKSTANMEKLNDKGYIDRKIKQYRKEIKDRKKNIEYYEELLNKKDKKLTEEQINQYLEHELELIEVAQDKEGFFINRLEELGGIQFSKDNIQIGDVIIANKFTGRVIGRGTKYVTYECMGIPLKASYAEIQEVKKVEK